MLLWRRKEEEDGEVNGALKPIGHMPYKVPLPVVINLPVRPLHSKCFRQVDGLILEIPFKYELPIQLSENGI